MAHACKIREHQAVTNMMTGTDELYTKQLYKSKARLRMKLDESAVLR